MTDHLTRLFEFSLLESSQCILVLGQIVLRIAIYKKYPDPRPNQMLWICTNMSGFNNYHKIARLDHILVPNFWRTRRSGQIPKNIYPASYFLPSDFSNNFS